MFRNKIIRVYVRIFSMMCNTSFISIPYGNVGTFGLLLIWILVKLIKFLKMREKSWMMDLSATSVIAISFLLISSFFLLSLRAFLDRYLYHSTNNVDTKCLSPYLFFSLSLSLWSKWQIQIRDYNTKFATYQKHSRSHK